MAAAGLAHMPIFYCDIPQSTCQIMFWKITPSSCLEQLKWEEDGEVIELLFTDAT